MIAPYRAIFTTADARPSWLLLDFNAADFAHARAYAVSLSGDPALPEWGALTLQRVVKLEPRDVGPTPYRFLPIAGPQAPPWARAQGRRR